jgi:hypothetical protein
MDPIYRVQRREPGAEPVQRVAASRLLTPAEREQAKKDREKKRKGFRPPSSQVRTSGDVTKAPPKERHGGADYTA